MPTPESATPPACRALVAAMAGMVCTACSTISPPLPLGEDSNVRPQSGATATATGLDPYVVFNRALATAQSASATSDDQVNLLNQGFSLLDYRCSRYFTVLGKAEQDLRFTRKQTSLTSGLVLSAMGLASASTKSVASVGSLFSFGTASMDSYEDVYIFSPDVKAVQRLVGDAMGNYRSKFVKDMGSTIVLSYTGVVGTLAEYESFCEPHGIRDLVNQSLAQVRTTTEPPASAPLPTPPPVPSAAPPAGAPAAPPASSPPAASAAAARSALQVLPRIDVRVVPRQ